MTEREARVFFGLKDTDPISEDGVLSIIKSNEEQLKVWSIGKYDRRECEQTIEACKALLRGVQYGKS